MNEMAVGVGLRRGGNARNECCFLAPYEDRSRVDSDRYNRNPMICIMHRIKAQAKERWTSQNIASTGGEEAYTG
jgi:hypothetical protein